ncbi:MarR family transcriptional regulator [Nocardioides sp. Root1257]|uniref:transcriptional regulator n=1 Tax=unclassified Nocardioides TaxID=2615069 RepID=UPI0006FC8D96|nr:MULTISPECIES: transcriptional regulator [unclassified Nocardioides]KQW48059.1 MarR family transcriptional regulator [Nocardioides sp. Root1257]KRC46026.1 MarR family transcriptional regulator [Nocardioides sp. Root224]
MSAAKFDELIHPSTRLTLVATLAAADWAEFAFLKDRLALSDSALSKQLATLEEAGYVATERYLVGGRRKLRARLTKAGRQAYDGHVAALRLVIDSAGESVAAESVEG